jgi:hypothetical protein
MMLPNVACYFECLPSLELGAQIWTPLFAQLEIFCARLILVLPLLNGNPIHSNSLLRIMSSTNRVAALQLAPSRGSILDSFALYHSTLGWVRLQASHGTLSPGFPVLQQAQVAHIPVTDSVFRLFPRQWETDEKQGCFSSEIAMTSNMCNSYVKHTC